MNISLDYFIKKYELDDFTKLLELKGKDKVDFYNDFNELIKVVCKIFDKLTTIASLRGGQVLMSSAKLQQSDSVINKTDIMNSLNIDRLEKLLHAFDYLEKQNFIKIRKKTAKFHMIELNEKDNPDFILFREIIQKYWITPEDEKEKAKKWSVLE